MKPIIGSHWWKAVYVIFFVFTVSIVQAVENETGNLTTTQKEASFIETSSTSPEPCQQLGKLADLVVEKSVDDSKAISNLTNEIYSITLFVMVLMLLAPVLTLFFQYRQEKMVKEWVNEKEAYRKTENDRLRQEMQDMKKTVHKELQNEFRDELMDFLTQKINKRVDNYGKLVAQRMLQQSNQHEERLYYVEEVRSELLKQSVPDDASPDNLSKWIIAQQEDYFALLQLISPDEEDTFLALNTFRNRDQLPYSFLELLQFLDKHDRLPGDSRMKAMEIADKKFGKSLVQED